MSAYVATAAGGVGCGIHGCLMGLVVDLHVLLMGGLMHLLMQGVNSLVLLLLDDRIRVVRKERAIPRLGSSAGIQDDGYEDAEEYQSEENNGEFHEAGDLIIR